MPCQPQDTTKSAPHFSPSSSTLLSLAGGTRKPPPDLQGGRGMTHNAYAEWVQLSLRDSSRKTAPGCSRPAPCLRGGPLLRQRPSRPQFSAPDRRRRPVAGRPGRRSQSPSAKVPPTAAHNQLAPRTQFTNPRSLRSAPFQGSAHSPLEWSAAVRSRRAQAASWKDLRPLPALLSSPRGSAGVRPGRQSLPSPLSSPAACAPPFLPQQSPWYKPPGSLGPGMD